MATTPSQISAGKRDPEKLSLSVIQTEHMDRLYNVAARHGQIGVMRD
jgi:hypothetical protein